MHESRLSPCANARHSIENLISKKRPLFLKTAGQQRIVGIMKPNERLFGDLRVCLCATKPIRCGCGRCDARTAMRTIFRNGTVARLRLAFARHYGGRSLQRIVFVSSPGKGKGPFGRAGLRENLRPGGEPGLTQGGGVRCLILGGAPVRTALG